MEWKELFMCFSLISSFARLSLMLMAENVVKIKKNAHIAFFATLSGFLMTYERDDPKEPYISEKYTRISFHSIKNISKICMS